MRHFTILLFILLFNPVSAQNYGFGVVPNGGSSVLIQATTNFSVTDADISDIGFSLVLPTGNTTISNLSDFSGRVWTVTKITATQLNGLSLGDGTKDLFVLNLAPGQTILSHTSGTPFDLTSFELVDAPNFGLLEFLDNNDPIAIGLGGIANSFLNANIDNTTTQDYFGGIIPGQESLSFNTLSSPEISFDENDITVYPNPASEYVIVKTPFAIDLIEIYSISGQRVLSLKDENTISIRELANGTYTIKAYSHTTLYTKKFIVNK
ncbi:T9SS type A sorting domain-containing protein [Winogradskyella sp.]|uniref:T9SS type A sorting domain-containing protein n=1 Tax=Winogradskyella sp. TaxID=1883156 RepID=UPI003BA8D908